MKNKNSPSQDIRVYTWRDAFMLIYFLYTIALGFSFSGDIRLAAYNISAIIVGTIGFFSVLFKLKRLEGVMIVTLGLLLAARAILLIPYDQLADNHSVLEFFSDILQQRALADGVGAIFPLAALAAYRSRRGRVGK